MNTDHGSPYDRGSADRYYGRERMPHKGGVGGNSGPRVSAPNLTDQEIYEYNLGYSDQDMYGETKEY